jgi:hypothetical protein
MVPIVFANDARARRVKEPMRSRIRGIDLVLAPGRRIVPAWSTIGVNREIARRIVSDSRPSPPAAGPSGPT